MPYAKFQDHRTISSVVEDFKSFFTIYGLGGRLGHVTWTIFIFMFLLSPFPRRVHIKFGFDWQWCFREKFLCK